YIPTIHPQIAAVRLAASGGSTVASDPSASGSFRRARRPPATFTIARSSETEAMVQGKSSARASNRRLAKERGCEQHDQPRVERRRAIEPPRGRRLCCLSEPDGRDAAPALLNDRNRQAGEDDGENDQHALAKEPAEAVVVGGEEEPVLGQRTEYVPVTGSRPIVASQRPGPPATRPFRSASPLSEATKVMPSRASMKNSGEPRVRTSGGTMGKAGPGTKAPHTAPTRP